MFILIDGSPFRRIFFKGREEFLRVSSLNRRETKDRLFVDANDHINGGIAHAADAIEEVGWMHFEG